MSAPTVRVEALLRELEQLADWLRQDLARMPGWKRGTTWHLDREKELAYLTRRIAELRAPDALGPAGG